MFLGQYAYTLDSKGRLTIPSRFRDAITDSIVVTRGLDRCLTVYPMAVWEEIAHKVTALPITDPRGRTLRRIFFADAVNAELDRQGRILLPERLREYAELSTTEEVTVVGLDRFIELWNPQRWDTQNAQQMELMEEDPALWENLNL
jgi:MraZ protein